MIRNPLSRGLATLVALTPAVLFAAGCAVEVVPPLLDEELPGHHFGDGYLATMFGSHLVDIWAGGQVVGDPIVLGDTPMEITAAFHDAGATMIMGLTEYELVMSPASPLLAFKPTGVFSGTLTRIAPGTTVLMVGLHNTERQLEDFGPFPVPVTVR
jgi:hypothetical protein